MSFLNLMEGRPHHTCIDWTMEKIKFAAHANNNKEACMAGVCIMQRLQDLYRSFVMTHACNI